MMQRMGIDSISGIRGTELPPDLLGELPASAPEAPWPLVASALAWFAPPNREAARALQPGITGRPLGITGMFVSYESTPVGPYDEIMGSVGLRRGRWVAGHVPFIAVDSPASIVGGRANWSFPKTLASFEGNPARDRAMTGRHPLWEVSATARALGPALPLRGAFRVFQMAPEGQETWARVTGQMRARPALVRVRTSGTASLTSWLRSGRYPGVIIERTVGEYGPARPV